MAENKRKRLIQKLRNKYKLVLFNEQTYEEALSLRLSRLNVFTLTGALTILLIVLVTLLIAFTGLREYIPGYPDANQRLLIVRNAQRVDSLLLEIEKRNRFIENVQRIISGDEMDDSDEPSVEEDIRNEASSSTLKDVHFSRSAEDSLFRKLVEKEERFNLSARAEKKLGPTLENTFFFSPIKGLVINFFDELRGHYGIDVVASPGERVSAVMDGIVFFSDWTVETGYVIQIQHANNLISVYKHNQQLLKSAGDHVKSGEAIASVGNSGELTSGPHLHFELWYNGIPLNPQEYISF